MTDAPAKTVPPWIYLGWDWRQAELFLLSLFSKDEMLRTALYTSDVHRTVMSWVFGRDPNDITKEEREVSKVVSYALIYSAFHIDSTVSNMQKKLPHLTREQCIAALEKYLATFEALYNWSRVALYDWYNSGGWVSYFMNQKKLILFPDYLKPEEDALRQSTPGRVALNTYGQNSVGLLLKCYLAEIAKAPALRENIRQHLPLFDACTHLVRTEYLAEIQAHLHYLATPVLERDGFEIQMRVEWKASLRSWGDMTTIADPVAESVPQPAWRLAWNSPPPPLDIMPVADSTLNPFAAAS